jgi:hypothetical protein
VVYAGDVAAIPEWLTEETVTTELHRRLMALAFEVQQRGEADLAGWIQKWIAYEQTQGKRRRGERKKKVRLGRSGQWAWLPERVVKAAERGEQ